MLCATAPGQRSHSLARMTLPVGELVIVVPPARRRRRLTSWRFGCLPTLGRTGTVTSI